MLIEVVHIKRLSKIIGHVRSARDAGVKAQVQHRTAIPSAGVA